MAQLIIHTQSRFEEEAVEKLAQSIHDANPDLEIKIADAKRIGYGVTWWEVIIFFVIASVAEKIVQDSYDKFIEWAKERILQAGEAARPQYISIFGGDGVPIKAALVHTSGEVEDKTEGAKEDGPRKVPPVEGVTASRETEEPLFLEQWNKVFNNHLATFVAWQLPSGKYRYRCVIQHHILSEFSDKLLTFREIEELFKARPELQEYF